jgi:hypothetical protein
MGSADWQDNYSFPIEVTTVANRQGFNGYLVADALDQHHSPSVVHPFERSPRGFNGSVRSVDITGQSGPGETPSLVAIHRKSNLPSTARSCIGPT